MFKNENKLESGNRPTIDPAVEKAVEAFGRVLHSAFVYGLEHRAAKANMDRAYALLSEQIARVGKIQFSIQGDLMMVNGCRPRANTSLFKAICKTMNNNAITSFMLVPGMDIDEFGKLLSILIEKGDDSFVDRIKDGDLQHVSSQKLKYKEVLEGAEGEAADGGRSSAADIKDLAEEWLASMEASAPASPATARARAGVEQIVAFIKGDVSFSQGSVQEELREAAKDPEKLAQLILDAAAVRQSQNRIGAGESIGDLVIGCLRRTYEGLQKQRVNSGSDSELDLNKSMLLLEKNIIDKLHRVMGRADEAVDDQIRAAIRDLGESADIDNIAREYMRQSSLLKQNEQRILEYIRSKDSGQVEQRMLDAGIPGETWKSLVAKSQDSNGDAPPNSAGTAMPGGLGALAVVMARFDELMSSSAPKADEIANFIDDIEDHVKAFEESTRKKIDLMIEGVKVSGQDGDESTIDHRRKFADFVEILAELAQELLQPLTVVTCSIDMVSSGYTGDLNDEQKDMLELAHNSANRLSGLIDRVTDLVGYPKSLNPMGITIESADTIIN